MLWPNMGIMLHYFTQLTNLKCGITNRTCSLVQKYALCKNHTNINTQSAFSHCRCHAVCSHKLLFSFFLTQKMTDSIAQTCVKGHCCSKVGLRELSGWFCPIEHSAASCQLHVNNQQPTGSIQQATLWLKANRYEESCNRMFC